MNKVLDHSGPAFPRPYFEHPDNGEYSSAQEGMSLRDWFAGQAMAGMMSEPDDRRYGDRADKAMSVEEWQRWCCTGMAEHAYRVADAMLKARVTGP